MNKDNITIIVSILSIIISIINICFGYHIIKKSRTLIKNIEVQNSKQTLGVCGEEQQRSIRNSQNKQNFNDYQR